MVSLPSFFSSRNGELIGISDGAVEGPEVPWQRLVKVDDSSELFFADLTSVFLCADSMFCRIRQCCHHKRAIKRRGFAVHVS